jgi:hypothetical protein
MLKFGYLIPCRSVSRVIPLRKADPKMWYVSGTLRVILAQGKVFQLAITRLVDLGTRSGELVWDC